MKTDIRHPKPMNNATPELRTSVFGNRDFFRAPDFGFRIYRLVCVAVLFLLAAIPATSVSADLDDEQILKLLASEQPRDQAIRRGLEYLKTQQEPNGSVGKRYRPALTSLSIIAFLAAGHTFDDPGHGQWLASSLNYVLTMQDSHGYFGGRDNGQMYGHGIATLMLAESLGMTRDSVLEERIQRALQRAVQVSITAALIEKNMPHAGGWHYSPDARESDLSLSGWQLMSLHAAQQVGITVPESVITNAVNYARRLTSAEGKVGYRKQDEDHPALRGLGLICLALGDDPDSPEIRSIAQRMQADPIQWRGKWFFYRAYYDAVGLSRAAPRLWESYGPRLERMLVDNQMPDGSWPSPPDNQELAEVGPVYTTCMAVLALAVQRHVLPAYQR
jgi:hypothetical protein